MAVLLDQPLGVVAGNESADGVTDLIDGLEDAAVHDLLLPLPRSCSKTKICWFNHYERIRWTFVNIHSEKDEP